MTPEQLQLEETRAWLTRARHDLRSAKLLIAGEEHAEALLHCQLTQYAWRFRYPGAPYEPGAAEAARGLGKAEMLRRGCLGRFNTLLTTPFVARSRPCG